MSRAANPVPAVLGALATLVLMLPLRPLFADDAWVPDALVGILVVLVSGLVLRALTTRSWVIVGGQLIVVAGYLQLTYLGGTTRYGVPTSRTVTRVTELVTEAQETITQYAAPAPLTPGVAAMLGAVVVLVALAVDLAAATADSPGVAGLPLLSLFLVSTANAGGTTHWGWFAVGALLWLAMLGHQAQTDAARWTTVVAGPPDEDGDRGQRLQSGQALRVGALVLALAVLIPGMLPHLPQRYVLDGLGRGGIGNGGGTIQLSDELALKESLESPSTEPVLRYTTDDTQPGPLRVAVVDEIRDGRVVSSGYTSGVRPELTTGFRVPTLAEGQGALDPDIERAERTTTFRENRVAAPQLAVPERATSVEVGDVAGAAVSSGVVRVASPPAEYEVVSSEMLAEAADFPTTPVDPTDWPEGDESLRLDPGSEDEIRELADSLAPAGATPYEAAIAIQSHLRGEEFTYSLELEPAEPGEDAIVHFLRTRTGYCQQFATTMTLLARARGIPARVAIGFLPGTADGEERLVRASDAHAWPELYFEGLGWMPFEPTAGQTSATVPGYSLPGAADADASSTSSGSSSATSSSTTSSSDRPSDQAAVDTGDPAAAESTSTWWRWPLAVLLGGALVLSVLPLSAHLLRRRRRRHASDDAARVEREWQEMISRLGDLGVDPPAGSTPRQAGRWIGQRLSLDEEQRSHLGTVVGTLERARYAPPGQALPDVGEDVDVVVGTAWRTRQRSQQLRALLWPRDGVRAWRALGQALLRRGPGSR